MYISKKIKLILILPEIILRHGIYSFSRGILLRFLDIYCRGEHDIFKNTMKHYNKKN